MSSISNHSDAQTPADTIDCGCGLFRPDANRELEYNTLQTALDCIREKGETPNMSKKILAYAQQRVEKELQRFYKLNSPGYFNMEEAQKEYDSLLADCSD
jgi:hypothetical protein